MNTMCTHTVHGLMSEIPVITSTGLTKDILAFAWKTLAVHFTLPGRDAGPVGKEKKTYRTPVRLLSSDPIYH